MTSAHSKPVFHILMFFAVLASLLGSAIFVTPAYAAGITVNTTDDELNTDGDCSLREAIQAANTDAVVDACTAGSGADVITVPVGTYTLSIAGAAEDANATGDLDINSDISISGAGVATTIIRAGTTNSNGIDRVFHITGAYTVSISGVTISNGKTSDYGGGIYNAAGGTLSVANSAFSSNSSYGGGGISNKGGGTLTVTDSTFSSNTANEGGGIENANGTLTVTGSTFLSNVAQAFGGGGIYAITGGVSSTVNVANSTFSNNFATNSYGGGIFNSSGTLTVTNSTLSGNGSTYSLGGGSGGIRNANLNPGTFNYANTIIANSTSGGDCGSSSGSIGTNTNNLVENGGCSSSLSGDPSLDVLASNGGATQTFALFIGSSAVDAGDDTTCANSPVGNLDQRGTTRPVGAHCDIGAYEGSIADSTAPTVNSFTVTTPSSSLSIPITAFTASDNLAVTGYIITASSTAPLAGDAGWGGSAPTTYTVGSAGNYTLYPWAKDAAGNVSAGFGSPRSVTVDTTAPGVDTFTATSPSSSLNIPITAFTASDTVGVTGYKITESSTPPSAGGSGWTGSAPTTYTVGSAGSYTLYPWAKDAAGNVSAPFGSPASVTVCTTITVTSNADSGAGSLRQAIADSCADVTINFNSSLSGGTINLASTLTLSKNVTIDGSALASQITISGDSDSDGTGDVRVLYVNTGVTVTLNSLVITKGLVDYGGGIYNNGTLAITNSTFAGNSALFSGGGIYNNGTLTITNSALTGNSAIFGGGIFNQSTLTVTSSMFSSNGGDAGGGIYNQSTLTVTDSTFSSNTTTSYGGGIYNTSSPLTRVTSSAFSSNGSDTGGGIYNSGALAVTNSTLSGNSAATYGGGIFNTQIATVTNSTLSGSTATYGGGIYNGGILNYANTIIANSSSGGDCMNDETIGANTNNLVEDGSCSAALSGDPSLGVLASNGGPTQTFALNVDSAAIGAGDNSICAAASVSNVDQRGIVRPQGAQCDIGSYEMEYLTVTTNADPGDGTCDATCSLRDALASASPGNGIDFDASLSGGTINLAATLTLSKNVLIDGSALASQITISGDTAPTDGTGDVRVFHLDTSGVAAVLDSLIITKGSVAGDGGGLLTDTGTTLTITNSTLAGNSATGSSKNGGGIYNNGTLTIKNSTLSGNSAVFGGGGIYNNGTLTLTNSTLAQNSASDSGGGIFNSNFSTLLTMTNSTLSGNYATNTGGGIRNEGTLNYANTIIANSSSGGASGGDCLNSSFAGGSIPIHTNNLVEDGSCSPALSGDPMLGALANNGGPTQTFTLLLGSIAIDAGNDAACAAAPVNNLDQRGIARPNGAHCDIGAYERYNIPDLLFPADGMQLLNNRTTFDWTDALGATKYTIQVSKNSGFTMLVVNTTVAPSAYTFNLPPGLTLYWRVRKVAPVIGAYSAIHSFTTARPPSMPVLVSPANNALTHDYTPRLDWGNSSVPAGTTFQKYVVELSAGDSSFASHTDVDVAGPASNSEYTPGADLNPNTKYYWRVRAYNNTGLGQYSNWSAARYFRTAMLAPILGNPITGTNTHTNRPDFDWVSVTGATSYTIQISKNAAFSMVIVTGASASPHYIPVIDLPRNMTLYWRVRANGANPSDYSALASFVTGNSPSTPVLLSPANNFLSQTNTLTLKWKLVSLAPATAFGNFEVQVSDDPTFSSTIVDDTSVFTNNATNSLTISPALTAGTTYYWRVRASEITFGDLSGWSPAWKIRTAFAGPTGLSPNGGATVGSLKPPFDWNDVTGATGYAIQVSASPSFSTLLLNKTIVGAISHYTPTVNLAAGSHMTLYWRVRANGPYGPGNWASNSFSTP